MIRHAAQSGRQAWTARTGVQVGPDAGAPGLPLTAAALDALPLSAVRIVGAGGIKDEADELNAAGFYPIPVMGEGDPAQTNAEWMAQVDDWVTKVRSDVYEVGNEPAPTPSTLWDRYFVKLKLATPIIRQRGGITLDTGGKVMMAAAWSTYEELEQNERDFIAAGTAASIWDWVDAVALHFYPEWLGSVAATAASLVNRLRDMRALIPEDKDLYITEFGYPTAGSGHPSTVTAAQARDLLDASFALLFDNRAAEAKRNRLRAAIWYHYTESGGAHWSQNCGLRDSTGAANPAWGDGSAKGMRFVGVRATTALNGAQTLPLSTITVDSTDDFESKGYVNIGNDDGCERVRYTDKTATTFTGCTGGSGLQADNKIVVQRGGQGMWL